MTTLLGISGALRAASVNRKLIREAGRLFGGDYVEADIRLPLYDGDLEAEGIPKEVQHLADQIAEADAVVISTPEYNQVMSGVLKNALDWVSRVEGNPWLDKPVAVVSAAAGRSGGVRAAISLRNALLAFQPRLLTGPEVAVAGATKEFDESGQLSDRYEASLGKLMSKLRAELN